MLAPSPNKLGVRYKSFVEAVESFEPQEYEDWPLVPPRTVSFAMGAIARLGYGPVARHENWTRDNKLVTKVAVVSEREVIAEVFELAAAYDQLDLNNLVCVERFARRVQLIAEGYRQNLEDRRLEKTKDSLTATLSEHFSGKARVAGVATVSHALIKRASERADQENELLKQQRKAIETRLLLKET